MSGETEDQVSAWTIDSAMAHLAQLRTADHRLFDERDRRYTEQRTSDQRAIEIKEKADERAMELERENRAYKDEKANNLREQISGERGMYATKDDVAAAVATIEAKIAPLAAFVDGQRGHTEGVRVTIGFIAGAATFLLSLTGVIVAVLLASP